MVLVEASWGVLGRLDPQEVPGSPREVPSGFQEAPKTAPIGAQDVPRSFQKTLKRHLRGFQELLGALKAYTLEMLVFP